MQNKKIIAIVLLFVAGFVLVYLSQADKLFSRKTNIPGEAKEEKLVKLNLPKLKCDFGSDQDAYNEASNNNNLDACSCISNEELKDMCTTATMDTILYSRALNNLDVTLCENIRTQVHKDSCNSAVKDSVEQLKKSDPQRLADIYARAHNEKAIDAYKNLTASDSSNINNYILLALAYAEKGLKEQEQGRDRQEYISNALVIIEEAKKIDNNNSEVYRIEAYVNEIKPDYSQALVLYDKAIEIDDKNIFAYAGKGHTERMLGMLEESVDNFNKAAKLDTDKNYVFIYTNLCSLEYSRGNSEIAFENCKIVTDKKDIDPVFQSNAHQTMAIILMRNNDIVQAENNLLKAKTLTPNDPNLFITLSKLNIFEKKYSESEVNAKRAIEFSPTSANAYLALAHALYMEEKFSESIMNAEKGVSLVKDDVSLLNPSKPVVERDLNYSIANCYREMGNIEKQEEFEEKAKNLLNNNK